MGSVDDSDEEISVTEGRPVRGVEVSVVDSEGRRCAPGDEGELLVRGPQLFRGYAGAQMDAGAFTADGFFHTGDIGVVRSSGHVQISGRLKDIIIRNAENLSALEIENALRSHPKVADVAVIGVPDPRTGECACAVVVLSPGVHSVTLDELGAHCRAQGLAAQKQPEQVEVVDLLPRNSLGKVLKRDLVRRFGR
jgi:non-ribosomal peptide synthetase component E (peptide arylation enzyme)